MRSIQGGGETVRGGGTTAGPARVLALLIVALLFGACATGSAYRQGEKEMKALNYDKAVVSFSKALASKPDETRYAVHTLFNF